MSLWQIAKHNAHMWIANVLYIDWIWNLEQHEFCSIVKLNILWTPFWNKCKFSNKKEGNAYIYIIVMDVEILPIQKTSQMSNGHQKENGH
jgi:hypothetical protein